jgi:hypothetical protein
MIRRCNGPADTLLLADGPVLLEGPGALDRRLVDAGAREDFVRATVRRKLALGRPRLVGREVGVRLDDVVLDQRVSGPAVDGEVPWAGGVVCAAVFDVSIIQRMSWQCNYCSPRDTDSPCALPIPSLSADETTLAVPVCREGTSGAVHASDITIAFRPAVEAATVEAWLKAVGSPRLGSRCSEHAGDQKAGSKEGELDHCG